MKTFIIRMKDNPISEELSEDLVKSLEAYNMNYEYFDAIHGDMIEPTWRQKGLKFFHKQNANKKLPGVKGCFLSHYILWEWCNSYNEPFLIFEHDAQVIRKFPDNITTPTYDVLNLDYASRVESDYEGHLNTDKGGIIKSWPIAPKKKGWLSQASKSSIKGLHAYIIKPSGAAKLIKQSHTIGTIPADVHVNSMYVDLKYTVTSYARINHKYWLNAKQGSLHSFTRAKE